MTTRQLFTTAVRILGVYLLVQAVMQVPTGMVDTVIVVLYWFHGFRVAQDTTPLLYPAMFSAVLGFVLYAAVGWYLLIGAPHLLRAARIDAADRAEA